MENQKKTDTNNQWCSLPKETFKEDNHCIKMEKTATDNQWTSTAKIDVSDKNTH